MSDELSVLVRELLAVADEYGAVCGQSYCRAEPRDDADPAEVHLVTWQSNADFERWRADARVKSIAAEKNSCLASWQTFWLQPREV